MEIGKFNSEKFDNNLVIKSLAVSSGVLAVLCLVLAIMAFGNRERLTIIPPHLDKEIQLSYESANENYYKSYSQYVATLIGNVNPGNAKVIVDSLKLALDSSLYTEIRGNLLDSAKKMETSGSSSYFSPTGVKYNPRSEETCVFGRQVIKSSLGKERDESSVFIFRIKIKNGLPKVMSIDRKLGKIKDYCL